MFRRLRFFCAFMVPALAFSANAAPPTMVAWTDDFLGLTIDAKYSQSLAGTGKIDISTFTGGAVRIYTLDTGRGNARLRFGECAGTSTLDVRNWNPQKKILFEARVFFSTNTDIQATVGFVGLDDPDNVLAAILDTRVNPQWFFQARANEGNKQYGVDLPTAFLHSPREWIHFKLTSSGGRTPEASLYINEKRVARAKSPHVPSTDLCPEFQIWNQAVQSGWSQPAMWLDWFRVQQTR